jgi:Cu(I)/Ag(I) efflux system membrane fusion protein
MLKVGMQVDFSILLNTKTVVALPTDAILLDGKGASVWKKTGHNKFESVMVHTGLETNEYTQILHGLNKGDTIVVSGAYLLNSEYMFKKGANPMEGHDMSKM